MVYKKFQALRDCDPEFYFVQHLADGKDGDDIVNFLLNYAEVHGLPSPVRNVNRVTLSIIFLPAEMSYRSVHRDFLAALEDNGDIK